MAGVWVGNDDDRGMDHVEGGGLPAELFRSYLARSARALAAPSALSALSAPWPMAPWPAARPAVAKVAQGW